MDTFSSLGFDTNYSFGQQSVFSVVDTQWNVVTGPKFEMITEAGIIMVTEVTNDEMITE